MGNLVTEYPTWAIILCPLVGLAFAAILYFKSRRTNDWSRGVNIAMATLRFALVTAIAFLLLGPLIRYIEIDIEPPALAIVVDNSKSMVLAGDSLSSANRVSSTLEQLATGFGQDYNVVTYTFGAELGEDNKPDFQAPVTDLSEVFSSLKVRYANLNLGAVVLLSDGIYNRGRNPRYVTENLEAPVYTLAFGDTTLRRDARITETAANRVAYLDNSFPIEVRVEGVELNGKSTRLVISHEGDEVFSDEVQFGSDNYTATFRAVMNAEEIGLQRYDVSLIPLGEEFNESNNYRSVYIDVIDDRQQILILANAPHPDLKAMRLAISSNINYEVDVELASEYTEGFEKYDLIILHQLPSGTSAGQEIRRELEQSSKPVFVVVGSQTALSTLRDLGTGVSFSGRSRSTNDVNGEVNQNFTLFTFPENLNELVSDAPPIEIPFGEWEVSNSSEIFLFQKVGRIATDEPLLVFNPLGEKKRGILVGEGIWRWRLADFARNENHRRFDEFFTGIVQYLAVKEDKRLFRVEGPDRVAENQSLIFRAELYTPAYEPVNDSEVNLVISDDEGREYPFTFSKSGEGYRLDAGVLPPDNYRYTASVERGGQRYTDSGSFAVTSFDLESARLTANHELLYAIADITGGKLMYPENLDPILEDLRNEDSRPKSVSYQTEIFTSIVNFRWLFFLLLALLSAEWFMRKYLGRY